MNVRIHPVIKFKVKMGYIVDIALNMGMRLYLDLCRLLIEQVEQYGQVMWREVPDDIDVVTEKAQVEAL
jgi:hypothetical protein